MSERATSLDDSAQPRTPGSAALVRLVAAREVSTRLRDRAFLISTGVILLLVIGSLVFQAIVISGQSKVTVGVVGDRAVLQPALEAQGTASGVTVTVVGLADEAAARTAVSHGDVGGAVIGADTAQPVLLVQRSANSSLQSVVQGAVARAALTRQLAAAGITRIDIPQVQISALKPQAKDAGERIGVAIVGLVVLYTLMILTGQFVAQGVVEEKSTRVVELLLATMRPWQLLAGKIIGLGVLGLAQIVILAVVGVAGAIAFHVVTLPLQLIGTALLVVAWFVLGYAFYAAVFAAAASLVSRQEDLQSVITPLTLLLVAGFVIAIQAVQNPAKPLAVVTSFIPGLAPMVMPVRVAAGGAALWEVLVAVALQLVGVAVVVRVGGRIYAGALLRTGGKTKIREALRAETA